ncbi:MAG: thymidine phosphorylase [Clostridiales bacterium]|nr:thymidine phosphorylase [Clostridiales bacterium]
MIDIIEKKKLGKSLSEEDIEYVVKGIVSKEIPDYQTASLLMAIYFQGMDIVETTHLTLAMANSGDRADLSAIGGVKVDKHSTGGVGDATTMIVTPLVAACGGTVAKMSGRGLGHTGGTLDKLTSIPNMKIQFTSDEFIDLVSKTHLAVVGQSGNLAPADKILYSLRDVTATVNNISLISSSIMSKKIAGGCDALVLDVKYGSGSFMKTIEEAQKLADIMVGIGKGAGVETRAILSKMDQPLGTHIGNALEVREIISVLKGKNKESRLLAVSLELGANMLVLSKLAEDVEHGKKMMLEAIDSGAGYRKLCEFIKAQGGDVSAIDNPDKLPTARRQVVVTSDSSGTIVRMDTEAIGRSAMLLGAGRATKQDEIDPAVGIVMQCQLGDRISVGDVLCTIHVNDEQNLDEATTMFEKSIILE